MGSQEQKADKTCVINDPLRQAHSSAMAVTICFLFKFVFSFANTLKIGDGLTYVQTDVRTDVLHVWK